MANDESQLRSSDVRTLHLVLRPAEDSVFTSTVDNTTHAATSHSVPTVSGPNDTQAQTPGLDRQSLHQRVAANHQGLLNTIEALRESQLRLQQRSNAARDEFDPPPTYQHQGNTVLTGGVANTTPNDRVNPALQQAFPGLARPQPQVSEQSNPLRGPPQAHTSMPTLQNIIAQQQQARASAGQQGVQAGNTATVPQFRIAGASNVQTTNNYSHEAHGPNGERWRVNVTETVTYSPLVTRPPSQPSGATADRDAHLLFQARAQDLLERHRLNHDRPQSHDQRSTSTNAVRSNGAVDQASRSASAPPLADSAAQSNQGPQTLPALSNPSATMPAVTQTNEQALPSGTIPSTPTVYLLSSPDGPRALLVNDAGAFITAANPSSSIYNHIQHAAAANRPAPMLPEFRNRIERGRRPRHRHANEVVEPVVVDQANLHPHNPIAGGAARQLLPHIWLVLRLLVFVWFFTASDSSWYRLFTIWGLALVMFLANTGVFNGPIETIWGPIRRHLEGLIPLHGPAQPPLQNAGLGGQEQQVQADQAEPAAGRRGEPDPAQVAARLVAQRRQANAGGLMTQIRRAEHAALLFLASLVPGIGERHIAAREAEANIAAVAEAERQRQEQEAAANVQEQTNDEPIPEADHVPNNVEETVARGQAAPFEAGQEAAIPPLIDV
jgi:hypothetical protein